MKMGSGLAVPPSRFGALRHQEGSRPARRGHSAQQGGPSAHTTWRCSEVEPFKRLPTYLVLQQVAG